MVAVGDLPFLGQSGSESGWRNLGGGLRGCWGSHVGEMVEIVNSSFLWFRALAAGGEPLLPPGGQRREFSQPFLGSVFQLLEDKKEMEKRGKRGRKR